jgi:hypothetical protein
MLRRFVNMDKCIRCHYIPLTDIQSERLQRFRLLDSYLKKRTATKNKIHGEEVLGIPSKYVYCSLVRIKKYLDTEISTIEQKLLSLVKEMLPFKYIIIPFYFSSRYFLMALILFRYLVL